MRARDLLHAGAGGSVSQENDARGVEDALLGFAVFGVDRREFLRLGHMV